jgi:protein-tyrosine phosphatase
MSSSITAQRGRASKSDAADAGRTSASVTAGEGPFEVAFLCTGNRFRSPLAAALLSAETGDLSVEASSLGVLELGPVPALPEAIEVAETLGVDVTAHRARDLAQLDLEPFDLVLGFERMHVRAAVVDGGARIERTFTLPELVALLESVPDPASGPDPLQRAQQRLAQAHEQRPPGFRTAAVPEIADPLGRAAREQRRIARELQELVGRLPRLLFAD